ncbi:MAG: hypothetical protein ABI947_10945 [Chloroflexota bacterium]
MFRKRSAQRRLIRIAGIFAVIALIVGIDAAARSWLSVNRPSVSVRREQYSPEYSQSPYWTPAFWREQDELAASWVLDQDGRWITTYHGHWFNVENGIRYTAYQPQSPTNTVYVYGNSAVFGFGVPDEDTIPSQLQLLFNKNYQHAYRVVNMAVTGSGVTSQWQILKLTKLQPDDIVIFYDGVPEVLSIFEHIDIRRNSSWSGQLCNTLMARLWRLGVVQVYCTLADRIVPPQAKDTALQQKITDQYKTTLLNAYHYTTQSGAQFYHFLQPHLWTMDLMPYEKAIAANPDLVEPGLGELFVATWPDLQTASSTIPASVDLTHVLDNARKTGTEMYIDFAHITEVGNAIIANAIFDAVNVF